MVPITIVSFSFLSSLRLPVGNKNNPEISRRLLTPAIPFAHQTHSSPASNNTHFTLLWIFQVHKFSDFKAGSN